ncbi:MAG: AAA family ATPase [Rhodospirillales bacterium]|nr:AAA family ATPase [Rhodospirillales bacterium]
MSEPFRVSPRRRDFFPPGATPKGADALTGQTGGEPARLLLISGEAGTGRTSALRQIFDTLKPAGWRVFTVETEALPHPEHLSDDDILLAACRNFGLFRAMTERKPDAAAESLRAHAAQRAQVPIAIAVDDADRLADAALVGLLRLAVLVPADARADAAAEALARPTAPDLAVLLAGPPDLRDRLDRVAQDAELPPLWDGGAAHCTLRPLSTEEVASYVEYCLDAAGCPDTALFEEAAIAKLAEVSHGVLSELNAIAAQAMIFAWQSSRRTITADLIERPGSCLPLTAPTPAVAARALVLVDTEGPAKKKRARRSRFVWAGSSIGVVAAAVVAVTLALPGGRAVVSDANDYLRAAFLPAPPGVPINGLDNVAPGPADVALRGQATPNPADMGRTSADQLSDLGAPAGPAGEASAEFLVARGEVLLRGSDAVSARRFFSRAAESGSASAATAMAASYDPVYLERSAIRGVDADPEQAAAWYRIAIARGDATAHERLDALVAAMAAQPSPQAQPPQQAQTTQPAQAGQQ